MALVDNGGGFIYDTGLNITWLENVAYALTCGAGTGGAFPNWSDATKWVGSVTIGKYSSWRLPKISELQYWWTTDSPLVTAAGVHFTNFPPGPLAAFWSCTEIDADTVWAFSLDSYEPKVAQKVSSNNLTQGLCSIYAWPVHDGNCLPTLNFRPWWSQTILNAIAGLTGSPRPKPSPKRDRSLLEPKTSVVPSYR
jgi:hypothetical protein